MVQLCQVHATTVADIVILLIGFIIYWIILGLSIYLASRLTGVRTTFGSAMITGILAVIAFVIISGVLSFLHIPFGIPQILGIIGALFVIKSRERVGWLHALGIAILAFIIFVVVVIVLGIILGVGLFTAFSIFH